MEPSQPTRGPALNMTPETVLGVPKEIFKKHQPKFLVGEIVRIQNILQTGEKYFDQVITVAGWARTVRLQANDTLVFIELNDGSCLSNLQIVVEQSMPNFKELVKTNTGTSFRIKAKLVKSPAKGQTIEMLCNDAEGHYCKVLGTSDAAKYPLAGKRLNPETLRDIAHLRPRTNLISSVTRVRNNLAYATHLYFQSLGFYYIHTPIITASDCEGAGEMFQVTTTLPDPKDNIDKLPIVKETKVVDYSKDFFKKPSFLTVSGQLAVENYCSALSNVYTFGPTFRAEVSHTTKHLAEFWMIEPEMAFADLADDMELAEGYIKFCLKYVLENNMEDLEFFEKRVKAGTLATLKAVADAPFKRVTYTEAIEILKADLAAGKVKFENKVDWGIDMATEHERYLAETVVKGPVIVYNYPKEIKSFYMKQNDDGKTVAAMDILVPGIGELVGGSQREDRIEVLDKRLDELKMDKAIYWWYRELRQYGSVPHSGFGLGFERMVMFCTGVDNIREVIPFPRTPGNAEF